MSRERELLERAYHVLGELSYAILKESGEYKLAGDIYEYLADTNPSETINNPEVDRSEPVAYLYDLDTYFDHQPAYDVLSKKLPTGTPAKYLKNVRPLYLHPAPRKPFVRLSEEEVNSLTYAPLEPYELICAVENRLAEKNK